jgi:hypothetical protein
MPTAVPESNRGSNATITMSREDLMILSVKKLKHLLKERDLPASHAAKSTLVDRLRAGKKAGPKSSKERRARRSQAKVVADRARHAKWMAKKRLNDPEYRQAERARDAERKRRSRSKPEYRQAERERPPRLLLECRP